MLLPTSPWLITLNKLINLQNEESINTERAEIGRRALELGITATKKYYERLNPKHPLPTSSIHTWKVQYADEAAKLKRKVKEPVVIKDLPSKK